MKLTDADKQQLITQFAEFLAADDVRIGWYRPVRKDGEENGWQKYAAGETTYVFLVAGKKTQVEEEIRHTLKRVSDTIAEG